MGVDIEKTKGMAVGNSLTDEDVAPVKVEGGEIEMVEQFTYLEAQSSTTLFSQYQQRKQCTGLLCCPC